MQINQNRDGSFGMLWLAIVTAAITACLTGTVCGQSEQELRQENQSLKARVQQLEAELDAARAQLEQLTQANADLATQVRELRRTARPVQPADVQPQQEPEIQVSIDESIPNASPRALLNAVAESYDRSMEDFADLATADDKERIRGMRALQKWAASVNRDLKSQIEWHVLPDDLSQLEDSDVLRVNAIDPKTGAILGDPFNITLTEAQVARLHRALQRQPREVLVLRGVLTPHISINEQRPTEGPFNNPPFIGPFAEFAYGVEVNSLNPALPATDNDQAGSKGATSGADPASELETTSGK